MVEQKQKIQSEVSVDSHDSRAFFNMMFFVQHGRVHSLRLSKHLFTFAGGFLVFVGIWAVCSVVYIASLSLELVRMEEDLLSARKAIFEYQSQYDGVYEGVYPHLHENIVDIDPFPSLDSATEMSSRESEDSVLEGQSAQD